MSYYKLSWCTYMSVPQMASLIFSSDGEKKAQKVIVGSFKFSL